MFNMLQNEARLELIQVSSGSVQYIAEAPPETSHTAALWTISRTEQVDADTRTIKVKQGLFAPGANGANLATIWGD
jgi:hypothetical protein